MAGRRGRDRAPGPRSRRVRTAIAVGALVGTAAFLAGCASDQPVSSTGTTAATTGTAPGSTTPAVVGSLVFRPVLALFPTDGPGSPGGTVVGADVASDDHGMTYRIGAPTTVAIVGAHATPEGSGGDYWSVAIELAPGASGVDAFNDAAQACHAEDATCPTGQLAVMLDDQVLSAPRIEPDQGTFTPFVADQIAISGGFDQAEATAVAQRLGG